ncbi:serine hydrolase domain-containing protein [Streptomyces kanamyceticus]|uniref:Class A beta-lactamase-related serine hydrolase n=1 Tax=Streptomyces kanamyceticus TaxID=1967 RepID=A0A5J6GSG7_STRKN|nr:serine hydrolase domain-containing protein [Streptomyces kanamyceticus]QEU95936.1 class A beta-lactamase-related serine hydrolase [Streptomyces kanamyceticus]
MGSRRHTWVRRLGAAWLAAAAVVGTAASSAAASAPTPTKSTAGPTPAELKRVDAHAEKQRERLRLPGMALAVVKDDEVVHRRTWGKDGDGKPITRQTPFLVGSLSKPITSTAVMRLAEAGSLRLDAPVRRYLPWFRPSGPSADRITLRNLLNQTSGLSERDGIAHADRFDNAPGGVERTARGLAGARTGAPPGERHEYSNANYMLLGAVVEKVTGQPFGDYLRKSVLRPFGMDGTLVDERDAERRELAPGHRYFFGHPKRFDPPYDASGVPYGYVGADIDDLSRFAVAHLGHGDAAARAVVSPAGLRELHKGTVPAGTSHRYGLGWRDDSFEGERVVWHGGATPGYHGTVVLAPERGLAVVVQDNAYSPQRDELLNATALGAMRILLGGRPAAASTDPMLDAMLTTVTVTAAVLALALLWSLFRIFRPSRGRPRGRRRIVVGAAVSVTGLLVLAVTAVYVLPRQVTVDLSEILLFVPDTGWLLVAIGVLATALAVTRGGLAVRACLAAPPLARTDPDAVRDRRQEARAGV